jgi:bla regulator protein blaR1
MRMLPVLLMATACWAQLEFEVASIKPSTAIGYDSSLNRQPGGVLAVKNTTLHTLILFAWGLRPHQLTGGPGWVDSDRWDMMARPPEGSGEEPGWSDAAMDRMRQRLRALLADRFKLTVHAETKEMPIYALVIAKGGPHLTPAAGTGSGPSFSIRNNQLKCRNISMQRFSQALGGEVGRSVVDRTGLEGDFDFEMKFATDASGPDFVTALQEQLGLKLEPTRGPVQIIVIDRVEKAAAN